MSCFQDYIDNFEESLRHVFKKFKCTNPKYQNYFCVPADFCLQVNPIQVNSMWSHMTVGLQITMKDKPKPFIFYFSKKDSIITFKNFRLFAAKFCGGKNQNTSHYIDSKLISIRAFLCGELLNGKKYFWFGRNPPPPILIYENNSLHIVMKNNGSRKWRNFDENAHYPSNKSVINTGCFVIRRYPRTLYMSLREG